MDRQKSSFMISVNGTIERAYFPESYAIWLRYGFVAGPDWTVVSGASEGLSAACYRTTSSHIVLDTQLEITYQSTNPYRWPQIVFVCYGRDWLGNEVVKGYGTLRIPTTPGRHQLQLSCAVPEPSTFFQKILTFLWGKHPELADPSCVAHPIGRDVLRMKTKGKIDVCLNVLVKDMKKFGFDVTLSTLPTPSNFPLPDFHIDTNGAKGSTELASTAAKSEARNPWHLEPHRQPRTTSGDPLRKSLVSPDEPSEQSEDHSEWRPTAEVQPVRQLPELSVPSTEQVLVAPTRPLPKLEDAEIVIEH